MATGDLEGNLERLRVQLRTIGYPQPLDTNGLRDGHPASVLPLLHYALLGYSRHVSRYLSENGYALFAKSDLRFVECTLKYLRGEYAYRCPLTVAQILSRGFAERKFLLVYDVIQFCKRKHSELVKQTRRAQQARKSIKRDTTLRDIVKNIDAANLDSLHMDETLSMALEKVSQVQGRANDRFKSNIKLELATTNTNDIDLERLAHNTNPPTNLEQSFDETQRIVERQTNKTNAQPRSFQPYENASNNNMAMEKTDSVDDVDASLSHCYEKLRAQIVEVAEKMEKLLLTLKGDVQRITSDMQVKLSCLERQALYLEQTIPSKNLIGQKTPSSYTSLQLYERNFPFKLDESTQTPFTHILEDANNLKQSYINSEIPRIQSTNSMGGLYNHQEQLSTEKLIASVKARCNKTKELLMDNGWIGAT